MMKYVDSQASGTTPELFARLDQELQNTRELRLMDVAWLSRQDFASELERVLTIFRSRGGRVVRDSA